MSVNLRAAALTAACLILIAGCGKQPSKSDGGVSATGSANGTAGAPAATGGGRVVNVYNWSDYIDPKVLEDFQKQTGIRVRYDVFDSNEVLETKLLTGKSGYDVVVPSAYFLERQIKAGVFQKLDKTKLPGLANMDAEISRSSATHDPDNAHSVVYMWGTTGIGYDADKIAKIMPDAPVDSWRMVFDPKVLAKFKGCGVSVLEDPTEIVSTVLLYLGKDPNSESPEDLKLAEQTLMAIRPYIRSINSGQMIDGLANGDFCVVIAYSGDVLQARDRADEAGKPLDIKYSIPKEGAIMWFDTLAIPADAPHVAEAHAFIEYMLRPEVAAANSEFLSYANPNAKATALLSEDLRNDAGVYPAPEVKAKLRTSAAKSAEFTRLLNRSWTRFMTGG
jgi:putrescine transport system substrate-binding protein